MIAYIKAALEHRKNAIRREAYKDAMAIVDRCCKQYADGKDIEMIQYGTLRVTQCRIGMRMDEVCGKETK